MKLNVTSPELLAELDEQLDWEPPALDDPLPSIPLGLAKTDALSDRLGPEAPPITLTKVLVELVDELELVEQLPELPLTLDSALV